MSISGLIFLLLGYVIGLYLYSTFGIPLIHKHIERKAKRELEEYRAYLWKNHIENVED